MSAKAKITIGIIVILVLAGGIFWVWNKWTDRFKTGADAIVGCQSPRAISNFFGRPGQNMTSYNLFGNNVSINEKVKPFLDNIQKEVNEAKTGYTFDNVSTFNIRPKVWGGGQSLHSWGIAIDINPDRNPYELGNYDAPTTDIPQSIIDIFKKHGFFWGGDWPGERDPMHFEWYGGEIAGAIIDGQSQQKITDVATFIDGAGSPNTKGDYIWILNGGSHEIKVKSNGYEDQTFKIDVTCFQSQPLDIVLKPLPDNYPGRITGKVTFSGNRSPLMPVTIYLDGRIVGVSNVRGDYIINNVRRGKHKVEGRIMLFPGAAVETSDMKPGEDLKNLNLTIGK